MKHLYLLLVILLGSNTVLLAGYLDAPFPWHATSKYSLSAENATVFVYIDFKNADRKLRKPLIVVEGFDHHHYT